MKSFIRLSIGILHSAFVFIGLILYYMVETEVNFVVTGDIFCCFNPATMTERVCRPIINQV